MVIRHNDRKPQFSSFINRIIRRNAVVASQNQFDPILGCFPDHTRIETVSVTFALRNIHVHHGSDLTEALQQNIGSADAVHIIISDDPDGGTSRCRLAQNFDCFCDIRQ